jgi:hypothetical protein
MPESVRESRDIHTVIELSGQHGDYATQNRVRQRHRQDERSHKVLIGPVELPLSDAVKMAIIRPAKVIGMNSKTKSPEEKNASIAIADDNVDICAAIVEGREVFGASEESAC